MSFGSFGPFLLFRSSCHLVILSSYHPVILSSGHPVNLVILTICFNITIKRTNRHTTLGLIGPTFNTAANILNFYVGSSILLEFWNLTFIIRYDIFMRANALIPSLLIPIIPNWILMSNRQLTAILFSTIIATAVSSWTTRWWLWCWLFF